MAARSVGRLVPALATAAVVGSFAAVRTGACGPLDAVVGARCSRPGGELLDRAVGAGTDLGSVYGVAGVTTALLAARRTALAGEVGASGLLAWCLAQGAKPLLPRGRPYQDAAAQRLVAEPAGTSWPSGHTAVMAAMVTSLAPRARPAVTAVAALVAAGVGWSRLYVGVHHLSDVVAGAGLGVLSALGVRGGRSVRPRRP